MISHTKPLSTAGNDSSASPCARGGGCKPVGFGDKALGWQAADGQLDRRPVRVRLSSGGSLSSVVYGPLNCRVT